jgi:hypothetical protein
MSLSASTVAFFTALPVAVTLKSDKLVVSDFSFSKKEMETIQT